MRDWRSEIDLGLSALAAAGVDTAGPLHLVVIADFAVRSAADDYRSAIINIVPRVDYLDFTYELPTGVDDISVDAHFELMANMIEPSVRLLEPIARAHGGSLRLGLHDINQRGEIVLRP